MLGFMLYLIFHRIMVMFTSVQLRLRQSLLFDLVFCCGSLRKCNYATDRTSRLQLRLQKTLAIYLDDLSNELNNIKAGC